jgi:hypothetical protein
MNRPVDVATAAACLGVSRQRVRRLLAQGRIVGWKSETSGAWELLWPLAVRMGTRGPRLGRKPQPRNICSGGAPQERK